MQDTIIISLVPGSIYSVLGNDAFSLFLSLSGFLTKDFKSGSKEQCLDVLENQISSKKT